ncbi:hypothetical protein Taro_042407 [Colocasia esculenta]|uniref:Uncharacterized protein n=1 Tax=Colocasia esculenta TaxID=4460 RepID=A0A843WGS8_COLES|nr:hypothetical protein [Colocasia esculenta]
MVAMLRGVATWLLSRQADPSRLGAVGLKTEAVPHFLPLAIFFFLLLPLSSSLAFSRWFFMLVVLVLRWCRLVRIGDMLVVLGARRRWPSDVKAPTACSPPPMECLYRVFGVVFERVILEPPSAEEATSIEVAMMSRRPCQSRRPFQSRHHRDALERRDLVATAWAIATASRQGRDGSMHRDYSRETGETSQQQQGARRAEETGR